MGLPATTAGFRTTSRIGPRQSEQGAHLVLQSRYLRPQAAYFFSWEAISLSERNGRTKREASASGSG